MARLRARAGPGSLSASARDTGNPEANRSFEIPHITDVHESRERERLSFPTAFTALAAEPTVTRPLGVRFVAMCGVAADAHLAVDKRAPVSIQVDEVALRLMRLPAVVWSG